MSRVLTSDRVANAMVNDIRRTISIYKYNEYLQVYTPDYMGILLVINHALCCQVIPFRL